MTVQTNSGGSLARLHAFIQHETTAGLILVLAAIAAIAAYNVTPLRPLYDGLLHAPVGFSVGSFGLSKTLLHWINDGLMAVFFFLVGLEIKREILEGNLSSREQIALPAIAAVGGMAVPAMIYIFINAGDDQLLRGWAIPAATDIAFALGALSLAGKRVPISLKVFLLTLATLDDLGAVVIIALFYTAKLSVTSLMLAGVALLVLFIFNRMQIGRAALYLLAGLALWIFVSESGVHATLAGVALAMMIPLYKTDGTPFIHPVEEALHPYVKFLILPLFAFANAGIPLDGFAAAKLLETVPLGIAAGLVIGKPLGVLAAVAAAVGFGWARLPDDCGWRHMAAVGCLAGIGFTMSLFIGSLAFQAPALETSVRVGVITGSVISTVLGVAILMTVPLRRA
ncbi:MAG: Na+/H+ antiporter NhaA [Rhizobiales bacterium]|nr:Na+/H+ antiporter NhaA [Hyphomicrobiales bacterium]